MDIRKQGITVLLICLLMCLVFPVYGETSSQIGSIADLSDKTVAIQTGTTYDEMLSGIPALRDHYTPSYFSSIPDMIEALRTGKADAVILDKPVAMIYCAQNPELMILSEPLTSEECGVAFAKGSPYVEEFNEALRELRSNGVLDDLEAKWMGTDTEMKKLPAQDREPVKGVLRVWLDTTYEPFTYVGEDGALLGYDIDVILNALKIMGYGAELTPCNFDGLIPALVSGKADLASSGFAITPERAESVDFSDSFYSLKTVAVVRDLGYTGQQADFLTGLRESFEKTFIRDNRWKLFVEGVCNTLIITVASAIFGTLLGFAAFMLCRACGRHMTACFDTAFSLLERMPIIVLLMVLYYIIFSNVSISGIAVSIAAFTLTFGAAMYGMLKTGVGAIGHGQTEAAYALGYNDRTTFFKIILPQAARIFLPSYRSELISLVKGTAVVGYIAVQDLTKMGDIVRSRTYEAFFPLMTTAVIYMVLTWLLTLLINLAEHRIDFSRRKPEKILKGVNVK